jgi:hypothetical protein
MLDTKSLFRMIAWENVPALCSKYFACNTAPAELVLFIVFSLVILFLLIWFYFVFSLVTLFLLVWIYLVFSRL